jgi:hypothetical protein
VSLVTGHVMVGEGRSSQIGLELAIGGVQHHHRRQVVLLFRYDCALSFILVNRHYTQSTTRSSVQVFTERKHLSNMALPKRIIKETERLMAEPYVCP